MSEERPMVRSKETDMPGLFDLLLPDGRVLRDITLGALYDITERNGWGFEPVDDLEAPHA